MSLFQLGNFRLHSGSESRWKIECDALEFGDWAALAQMLADKLPPFGEVLGVPTGGMKLADAMKVHQTIGRVLIVDDVYTTGSSMVRFKEEHKLHGALGAVVFARNVPTQDWIFPLFMMTNYIEQKCYHKNMDSREMRCKDCGKYDIEIKMETK